MSTDDSAARELLDDFDCSELGRNVFAYIDDELTPVDCERIKTHLNECPECLSEYERDLVLKSLIRRSCHCESAPASLRVQILTRITAITLEH